MAEKRKKEASVCVRRGAKVVSVELFPATEWAGPVGRYRLRVDRAWLDGTRGNMRFLGRDEVGAALASVVFGADVRDGERNDTPPDIPKNARVLVPVREGSPIMEQTFISTEAPFRGADGRWYVGCYLYGQGVVMIPCEQVQLKGHPRMTAALVGEHDE